MSAYEVTAIAAAITVTVGGVAALLRWGRPGLRRRRDDRELLGYVLHGKSDLRDAQGNLVEPGHPALSRQLADLHGAIQTIQRQFAPNGGSSIADAVARIDQTVADLRADQQNIKADTAEVRQLAGEAAVIAARVEQREREDMAAVRDDVASLDEKINDLRSLTHGEVDRANREAAAMRAIAVELGMPWPDDPAAT